MTQLSAPGVDAYQSVLAPPLTFTPAQASTRIFKYRILDKSEDDALVEDMNATEVWRRYLVGNSQFAYLAILQILGKQPVPLGT